jgi:hypothetical protein
MADQQDLLPGTKVRVRPDPLGNSAGTFSDLQVPRYVWERSGVIDVVLEQSRYAVRFSATELWGDGHHDVIVVLAAVHLALAEAGE